MPRKKKPAAETTAQTNNASGAEATATAVAEAPAAPDDDTRAGTRRAERRASEPAATANAQADVEGRQEPPKNWGDPYKSIFTCPEQGFELGEDRRFKQRVFRFADRPANDVLAELKDRGFTYRAGERSWTVPADADTRKMTDEMARRWAGPDYVHSIER